jgi:hypothetical protein
MTDAELTLGPKAGAVPVDPPVPGDAAEPVVPPVPAEPVVPPVTTEPAAAAAAVAPAEPIAAEPVAPEPVAPALSQEELAAIAASAPVPTAEELAALAAAVEIAVPLPGVGDMDTSNDDLAPVPTGPTAPVHARRRLIRGWTFRLVTSLFALGLFVFGMAMGVNAFNRMQPPPPVVGDPSTGGVPTPPVVSELAKALASNDADSMRSAMAADPYRLLTGELQSWQIQGITSVETLATMQDGPRSATEIVITGKSPSGDPRVFNLVVHVDDNQIVTFR